MTEGDPNRAKDGRVGAIPAQGSHSAQQELALLKVPGKRSARTPRVWDPVVHRTCRNCGDSFEGHHAPDWRCTR